MTDTATVSSPGTRLLLQQAMDQLNQNDAGLAEATLLQVLSQSPEEPDALQLLGLIRKSERDYTQAETLLRRSLAARPGQPHVQNNLGNVFYAQQNYSAAIAAFAEALRLKPNYAEAYLNMALAQRALNDFAAAEKSCRTALRYQPGYLMAAQTLGVALMDQARPKEAEQVLRNAIAAGSRNPYQMAALQQNLAVALQMQGRFDEALPLLDAAQAAVPDIQAADYNRGDALEHLGRFDEAIMNYRRALAADPQDIRAHGALNNLLYRLERDDEFMQSYEEARAIFPEASLLNLSRAEFLLKMDRHDEARETFAAVASREPGNIFALDGLAMAFNGLRDYGQAIAAQQKSLSLNPASPDAWSNLALIFAGAGEAQKAEAAAQEALARDPRHQAALAMLDVAWRMTGDARAAWLNDYDDMVQIFEIAPPEGYGDIASFNRDLDLYLDRLHRDRRAGLERTVKGGTQTTGDLFGKGHRPIEPLRARFDEAVTQYIARMKDDAKHPFFSRRTQAFKYAGAWSSRLRDGGYHINHVHPQGWISSAYYVALPESVADEKSKEGWTKFGEPGIGTPLKDAVHRNVQPKTGQLVLFPSYMWHGTIPFHSQTARTTIAFDVVPR